MNNVCAIAVKETNASSEISINQINKAISLYMQIDFNKDYMIDIMLATAISIEEDYPVWIMIIAPPSSGKTELLNILQEDKYFHPITGLTPKFLFSGDDRSQGGYMNRVVKKKGLLAFPDFTTITSQEYRKRKEIFNQLRIIHDGKAGLGTGIDIGDIDYWEGKVAVIGCVTETIHKIKDSESDLGDRFIYYAPNVTGLKKYSLVNYQKDLSGRKKVQGLVKRFLTKKRKLLKDIEINSDQMKYLINICSFISLARASVIREGYSREITYVHQPEGIHRLLNSMEVLFKCLLCISNDENRTRRIIRRIALSTIPANRFRVLDIIAKIKKENITLNDIIQKMNISNSKIRRDVEDLVATKILTCHKKTNENLHEYSFSPTFNELWTSIKRI